MRYSLAFLLICALASDASAENPVALVLANSESAPEVIDPAASNSHEAAGETNAEGELDAADLSKLGGRLASIALAYESFLEGANHDADSKMLVEYVSPQGLIPNPADRTHTLDRLYRTLALIDDTQALRYPEGEACARAQRLSLLRSSDGLFSDPKSGELRAWLKAELKRSKANAAPGGLVAASAREWTPLGYLKSLAEIRALSLSLGDRSILGAPRAAAFCRRAKVYEELAAAQTSLKWNDPDLSEQAKAVVEVRWGKERGAGTLLLVEGKTVVLVSGRFTENPYEPPDLITKSGKRLASSYLRRGSVLSLLSTQASADVTPLSFPEVAEQGERVAYAVGHPVQGGPWSVTRGLAVPDGAFIRTDAAIDGSQAGGPLFDAQGRLTGIIADQGMAFDLIAIKDWLTSENAKLAKAPATFELGTGALLTASSVIPVHQSGLIEAGIVCKDSRGCDWPPPSRAPQSRGFAYSAPSAAYMGPSLWSMLGKLLQPAPKKEHALVDNRPSTAHAAVSPVVPEAPKPPPDPLIPISLQLSVSRTMLAQGEEFEAVATIAFKGKEGSRAGRSASFNSVPGGKIKCSSAKTDGSGVARATCMAMGDERETKFDSLEDEVRRRLGKKTAGRVRRKVAKGDKIGALKERQADQMSVLDGEEEKHPDLGTGGSDTPGIDRPLPEADAAELEIKGDRVTFGASLETLLDSLTVQILERPCPDGSIAERQPGNLNRYRCGDKSSGKSALNNFSEKADSSGTEAHGEAVPDGQSPGEPNEAPGQTSPNGTTPEGRPYTRHYSEETGPVRNIPGSVVDHIIESVPPHRTPDGKNVRYDSINDVTVVTGRNGIISVHVGKPRKGQLK